MKLEWGSYIHPQDEVGVKINYQSVFDTFGRRIGDVQEWHILGAVIGSSQADLTTKLGALETAYSGDYQDLKLTLNDGTDTQHVVLNSNTFGGTHVVFFGYVEGPWKMQLEYANRRTFYIVIRAEIRVGQGHYAYKERLTIKGTGGPKFRYMPSLNAAPVSQTLQPSTTWFYVQQGMSIGRKGYTLFPTPIFPGIEHQDQRRISYDTPKEIRVGGSELYMVSWQYVMEASSSNTFTSFVLPAITQ